MDLDNAINPEVYELYLKAKHIWNRKTTQDKEIAMGLLKSISLDPDFLNAKILKGNGLANDPDKALVILKEANELALKPIKLKH